MAFLPPIAESVPLVPLTTLGLGGSARFFAEVTHLAEVAPALAWAKDRGLPVFVLGGGSNLVVAGAGFPGLVLRLRTRGQEWREAGGEVCVDAAPVQNIGAYGQEIATAIRRVRVLDRASLTERDLAAPA